MFCVVVVAVQPHTHTVEKHTFVTVFVCDVAQPAAQRGDLTRAPQRSRRGQTSSAKRFIPKETLVWVLKVEEINVSAVMGSPSIPNVRRICRDPALRPSSCDKSFLLRKRVPRSTGNLPPCPEVTLETLWMFSASSGWTAPSSVHVDGVGLTTPQPCGRLSATFSFTFAQRTWFWGRIGLGWVGLGWLAGLKAPEYIMPMTVLTNIELQGCVYMFI